MFWGQVWLHYIDFIYLGYNFFQATMHTKQEKKNCPALVENYTEYTPILCIMEYTQKQAFQCIPLQSCEQGLGSPWPQSSYMHSRATHP